MLPGKLPQRCLQHHAPAQPVFVHQQQLLLTCWRHHALAQLDVACLQQLLLHSQQHLFPAQPGLELGQLWRLWHLSCVEPAVHAAVLWWHLKLELGPDHAVPQHSAVQAAPEL